VYSHVPPHEASQLAPQLPLHDAAHVPLQLASQVGQPGQVHAVGQVHCSPNTVPFGFSAGVV
jgi:hypothetical protein